MIVSAETRAYWERCFRSETGSMAFGGNHDDIVASFATCYLPHPSRVLVVGSGTGRNVLYLASMGHDVFGLDLSSSANAMASTRLAAAGYDCSFVQADMSALPWPANTFVGAICLYTLDHTDWAGATCATVEIQRVLGRAGHALVVFDAPDETDGDTTVATQLTDGTLRYERGPCRGLLYRPYPRADIEALFGSALVSLEELSTGAHAAIIKSSASPQCQTREAARERQA